MLYHLDYILSAVSVMVTVVEWLKVTDLVAKAQVDIYFLS